MSDAQAGSQPRPRIHPDIRSALLWSAPIVFLALFYFLPLGSVLRLSLERSPAGPIGPFLEVAASPAMRGVIGFTLGQAALSTAATLAIGLPGAYLLARFRFPGKALLRALTGIPFVLPTLVVASAFNALLGPRGWINLGLMQVLGLEAPPLRVVESLGAIVLAHVFYNTTIVLRMVGDFWSHLDPRMTQSARVLGAGRWATLWRVTLPLLAPAIAAAGLLVFLFDFTSFGVVLLLGGPRLATIEVEIYRQTMSLFNLPVAAALSILQLGFTLAVTFVYLRLAARLSHPVSLRPREAVERPLRSPGSLLGAALMSGILLALLILPLAALAARSVVVLDPGAGPGADPAATFTLEFYRTLSLNPRQALFFVPPLTAIAISLGYASATVVLSVLLGLPAAWALSRRPASTWSRVLDPLLMLPLGTSAVTLGLGFILALGHPPLDLRTSPLLVPLAHTLVALPFVVRSLSPALRSIRPPLRRAASVLGASPIEVARRVDLPLVGRALAVAATFAFMISLGEFGATALIARPEYPTVPLVIYRLLSRPGALNYGQGLALSTILMALCGLGMLSIERLRVPGEGTF